jgi:glutathione S-transferase
VTLVLHMEPYWHSPWDLACWMTLREKGLPFARSVGIIPGGGVGANAALRARLPAARIPALQHGDYWLSESFAIVEYLEEVFPSPPVLPRDPRARGRARQLSLLARNELRALRAERPAWMIFYPASPPPLGAEARHDADELLEVAADLVAGGAPFAFGDFTLTDVDLAFALRRLIGEELAPDLRAYVDRVWARPSVAEYVEHPRPPNPPGEDRNTRR